MKINSISLVFSDLTEESAKLEIVLDPPLAEGTNIDNIEFEDQPCLALSNRVMQFLTYIKMQEGAMEDGGPGADSPTLQ